MSSKSAQMLLDMTRKLASDSLKTASKMVIEKTRWVLDNLVGNKSAAKKTKVVTKSPK